MKTLKRKIMRGIYYAYALRLVSLPGVLQGFLMLGVLIALTRFVSLGNVLNNLRGIELTQIDMFVYNAFRTTELWTLLLVGLFVFCALSFRISLVPAKLGEYSYARI